jgi:O-antigen/teichoic acid export membrane protein
MLISVLLDILQQHLIRHRQFGEHAKLSFQASLGANVVKLALGNIWPTAGSLILGSLAGNCAAVASALYRQSRRPREGSAETLSLAPSEFDLSAPKLGDLTRRYADFPLMRMPQNLLNGFTASVPLLLLASYSNVDAAGFYTLAVTVVAAPMRLIGSSVSTVLYPHISRLILDGRSSRRALIGATSWLIVAGFPPLVATIVFGPAIFAALFGEQWREAGQYASWLAIPAYFQLVSQPVIAAVPALGLQGGYLAQEVLSSVAKVTMLWGGLSYLVSDIAAVALYSLTTALTYAILILWVIIRSRGGTREQP